MMKYHTLMLSVMMLSACTSAELMQAEHTLQQFHCSGIEISQISHSAMSEYYQQSLYSSKANAIRYVDDYKNGDGTGVPLNESIVQQFELYQAACQNLGGILIQPLDK